MSDKSTTTGYTCYIVDSFATKPGMGNPAAVVLLPTDTTSPDDDIAISKWMQTVAMEFNLSETAFCWPSSKQNKDEQDEQDEKDEKDDSNKRNTTTKQIHWNIRYFTPTVEVPLCGHATLASAYILFQTLQRQQKGSNHDDDTEKYEIVFHAREDILRMKLDESTTTAAIENSNGSDTRKISMEFPLKPPKKITSDDDIIFIKKMLKSAFFSSSNEKSHMEFDPIYVGISDIGDMIIELTIQQFNQIGYEQINYKALLEEFDGYHRGVILCCLYDDNNNDDEEDQENDDKNDDSLAVTSTKPDFLSRFFGPKAGIDEDPVTGSAHCVLAPYFAKKLNKEKVIGRQTSLRGGTIECSLVSSKDTVQISGTAVTTMSGTLWF